MTRCRRSLPFVALLLVVLGVAPAGAANDNGFEKQWHLHIIGAETAWPTGTGLGISIAVVDTGVDLQHPDLRDKLLPGKSFVAGTTAQDDHGHGTHVAGIAAAVTNNSHGVAGVAADARILPVKVLGRDGTGDVANVAAGIRWAADNGAAVINASLGVEKPEDDKEPLLPIDDTRLLDAVKYASDKGVVCVLAAGNDPDADSAYANERAALVVGATDRSDRLASYSSPIGGARSGMVAPGGSGEPGNEHVEDNVLSTYWEAGKSDLYAWAAGTSMAAPHVAGAAAVLRGLGLDATQTIDRITATAKDLGPPGKDATYGHGRLDLAKAVSGLTPVETRSATGAPRTTPTTALRTTVTTRPRPARTTPTTAAPTTTPTAAPTTAATTVEPLADLPTDPGPAAAEDPPDSGSRDDDLPAGPPLVATGLLAAAVRGLVRARRV